MKIKNRFDLKWEAVLLILVLLVSKGKIAAEEIFDKPIVEVFSNIIGNEEYHNAGVDIDGDGLVDLFIYVLKEGPLLRRLSNFLKEGAKVSFDDSKKIMNRDLGAYTLKFTELFEIGGKSVLQIFPNQERNFPAEAARQIRLKSQSNGSINTPVKNTSLMLSQLYLHRKVRIGTKNTL